jgi:hypothetical protein
MKTGTRIIFLIALMLIGITVSIFIQRQALSVYLNLFNFTFLGIEAASIGAGFISNKNTTPRASVNNFLMLKVAKILVSLAIITYYIIVCKENIKQFLLGFAAIYLIYLVFDTVYLLVETRAEKK